MTASIELIKASDGSGNANIATVQNSRSPGSSTIVVDTVAGINPVGFAGTMGTPHTFTDPVTSETITVISEATAVDFTGHVDGSNLEIDVIAPGYSDLGSEVGDIIIIRPTTQWGDNVAELLEVSHEDDGTLKDDTVDTLQILDGAVETAKIDDGAVDHTKVAAGIVVQVVSTSSTGVATGTTTIPQDDTIPQNTEGTEFLTQAITPKSATNILVIEANLFLSTSASGANIIAAMFQDSTANALSTGATFAADTATLVPRMVTVQHTMVAGTTSATTFKMRAGTNSASTVTFNGISSARLFGAITKSVIKITEYKA